MTLKVLKGLLHNLSKREMDGGLLWADTASFMDLALVTPLCKQTTVAVILHMRPLTGRSGQLWRQGSASIH